MKLDEAIKRFRARVTIDMPSMDRQEEDAAETVLAAAEAVRQMEEMLADDPKRWFSIRPARGLAGEHGIKIKLWRDVEQTTKSILGAQVLRGGVPEPVQRAYDEWSKR